jgi:hypothetical protein
MVDNKYTRNILIIVVGLAIVILAIVIANITYRLVARRSIVEEPIMSETSDPTEIQTEELSAPAEADLYETCVLISTDKNIVLNNRELLSLNGYPVKIKESQRANKLIFSLIIDKQLSREDAILLGEEIKDKFSEINSYWIERVAEKAFADQSEILTPEDQSSVKATTGSDTTVDIGFKTPLSQDKAKGIKYEVQIMANTDLEKITATKQFLESEGYKIKIVEFVKNGLTYYRLRLAENYSQSEAELIGSELKQNYKFINSYWLDKVEE